MIPALLSCLFVLYLYRTLNEPGAANPTEEVENSNSANEFDLDGLDRELSLLRQRLAKLTEAQVEGGNK